MQLIIGLLKVSEFFGPNMERGPYLYCQLISTLQTKAKVFYKNLASGVIFQESGIPNLNTVNRITKTS